MSIACLENLNESFKKKTNNDSNVMSFAVYSHHLQVRGSAERPIEPHCTIVNACALNGMDTVLVIGGTVIKVFRRHV